MVNNLKNLENPPYTSTDTFYSAFRGPNTKNLSKENIYFDKKLIKEEEFKYNKHEPLYLFHGIRNCIEKKSQQESFSFLANHFFKPTTRNKSVNIDFEKYFIDEKVMNNMIGWFKKHVKGKLYPSKMLKVKSDEQEKTQRELKKSIYPEAPKMPNLNVSLNKLLINPKKNKFYFNSTTVGSLNRDKIVKEVPKYGNSIYKVSNHIPKNNSSEKIKKTPKSISVAKHTSKNSSPEFRKHNEEIQESNYDELIFGSSDWLK